MARLRQMPSSLTSFILFATLTLSTFSIHASEPHPLHDQETYEAGEINAALEKLGWERLTPEQIKAAEGEKISEIKLVGLEIFQARDFYPDWLNHLHEETKPWVIERELLFEKGSTWTADYSYETERILRKWLFLSWVRVVPARAKQTSELKVLVITQDLWSLRTGFDFSLVNSRLELLDIAITESNLMGQAVVTGPAFHLDLGTMNFGALFSNYRFGHSNYGGAADARVIVNRNTGAYEGERFSTTVTRPLIRLDDKWGADLSINYNRDIYRAFSNGQIASLNIPETGESALLTYNRKTFDVTASVTRSYGRAFKSNWSGGYGYFSRLYPLIQSSISQSTADLFTSRYLPTSESAGYLFIKWDGYQASFQRRMNLDTYAITEDVREGLSTSVALSAATPAIGGGSNYLLPSFALSHNSFFGEAILSVTLSGNTRYQPNVDSRTSFVNRNGSTKIKYYSPYFGRFRYVASGEWTSHSFDRNHTQESLGSDSTLRGFPSSWLRGSQLVTLTQEIRSEPIHFLSTYLGVAAFQDWGDAFEDYSTMRLRPTLGLGLRVGFTQFNREVIRFDLGFPLHTLDQALGPTSVIQFNQAI